jgi:hypothetical protein
MHVKRDENPTFQIPFLDGIDFGADGIKSPAVEEPHERFADLQFPRYAQRTILEALEEGG